MKKLLVLLVLCLSANLHSQSPQLVSGPMLGYVDMMETGIWLQTDMETEVSIDYWPSDKTEDKLQSLVFTTQMTEAYTARIPVMNLEPGVQYSYQIHLGDEIVESDQFTFTTQKLWQHREDPPAFSLALGSCAYISDSLYDRPGKPYGSDYEIFESIADKNPNLMLWLGDNIYLREPDWGSWSGYLYRYTHMRKLPEMQRLLQTTHHYAIWDDHDFGPNDGNGSWVHKDWALDAFKLFWMNPSYGVNDEPGITTAFSYNDVHFFLLDNRYNRTSEEDKETEPQILGHQQIEWLIQALKYSRAKYKLVAVGGQVLSNVARYENHAVYGKEREYLIKRIDEEKIEGVIFLTGDRHHTELSELTTENGILIYDLTISPLTSRAYDHTDEPNEYRVEGTIVGEHNFAILEFTGTWKERKLMINVYNKTGEKLWQKELKTATSDK